VSALTMWEIPAPAGKFTRRYRRLARQSE